MKLLRKLSPLQSLALGFLGIIFLGSILLSLPVSNRPGVWSPFLNALYTSVSATCVTGLSVYDIYSQFTLFGQLVILLLIQTGGLGFMTLACSLSLLRGKQVGLRRRMLLAEAVSAWQIGGVQKLAGRILGGTLLAEGLGAVLLGIRFVPRYGVGQGIWMSIFHAVSAFCNAGFDLMGIEEPGSSLVTVSRDSYVLLVLAALVIIGGMGFLVWRDLAKNKFHWRHYTLHTKIMLSASLLLLIVPTVLFLFFERGGVLSGMSPKDQVVNAFFQSVTTRTAGFFTFDNQRLSQAGWMLTILLMFVGAGAGSTGGGVKVTTVTTAVLALRSYLTGSRETHLFRRRLSEETVHRSFLTVLCYLLALIAGCFLLTALQDHSFSQSLYEATSALGTVGLSSGITASLSPASMVVEMILMYLGRVGSLSVAMAVSIRQRKAALSYPEGKILM